MQTKQRQFYAVLRNYGPVSVIVLYWSMTGLMSTAYRQAQLRTDQAAQECTLGEDLGIWASAESRYRGLEH